MEKQIQLSNIFAYCSYGTLIKIPDYQITSNVFKLEVQDEEDILSIKFEMRLELIDHKSGESVLIHRFDRTKPLESRDLNLFAAETSIIFQDEVNVFISKMRSYFKNNLPFPADEEQ